MKSLQPAGTDTIDLPDDPRLVQAVQDYLHQLEAGQLPNRQEVLRRYPDLAEPLTQCLDGLELVHKAAIRHTEPTGARQGQSLGGGEPLSGNPLGDFQMLREIGRGGMGVVYEAVQLSLQRKVALKVLPFAATFDATHLQRFHNEARAAGQLHHTNIVPVYAVGCERGVHFYAMQLIEGQSLAVVIQQVRQQLGKTARTDGSRAKAAQSQGPLREQLTASLTPLPPALDRRCNPETVSELSLALATQRSRHGAEWYRAMARFMVQAADALEHAHQFGIVHRDIKPGNLLADVHGRLWITDFGLAQFHTDVALTQTGDLLGTLRYMSPEQACGQRVVLDHRTDVYSLGATLYELVTLEPIFPGRNRQELLNQIIHDEPRAPRYLEKTVPVELETIVLKAVSKNPADRYSAAREFAADLQRFLEDQPVLAKRPNLLERGRKWMRRHPAYVHATFLLLLFCVVGSAIGTALIAQEQGRTQAAYEQLAAEQAHTKAAYEAEARQRARAEADFAHARRSIEFFVQFSEGELAHNPAPQEVRRRLLETALDYYQDFLAHHDDEPSIHAALAASRARASQMLAELSTLRGSTLMNILQDHNVQEDLDLNAEQRKQVTQRAGKFADPFGKAFSESFKLSPEERRAKALAWAREAELAILEILHPDQKRRFKEIVLQVQQQGRTGLSDPNLVETLKLTSKQRERLRKRQNEAYVAWSDHVFRRKKLEHPAEFWADLQEDVLTVLTPAQRERWRQMSGAPITVDFHYGYPFDGREPRSSRFRPPRGFGGHASAGGNAPSPGGSAEKQNQP